MRLTLRLLPGAFAVCRLPPEAGPPTWLEWSAALVSVTRTAGELSVVCPEAAVPAGVRAEPGWRALAVDGPLDFALTGVLAGLARPLAEAGVSLFALSTYDTDLLLVRAADLERTVAVLGARHRVIAP